MSAFTDRFIREARLRRAGNRLGAAFDRIAGSDGLADPEDICPPSPHEVAELEALLEKRAERDAALLEQWCETIWRFDRKDQLRLRGIERATAQRGLRRYGPPTTCCMPGRTFLK